MSLETRINRDLLFKLSCYLLFICISCPIIFFWIYGLFEVSLQWWKTICYCKHGNWRHIVYIIDINEKIDLIDMIIRNNGNHIIISIKYSGVCINIMEDEDISSNIAILNNISQKIDYSQILGLNNIVMTIK